MFENFSDEEIINMIHNGNSEAENYIYEKYRNFIKGKTRSYFIVGADSEDIIQEGMIGLFKAVKDFDIDKNSSFRAFAELCVNRQIQTAVKTANRKKHEYLNKAVMDSGHTDDEGNEISFLESIPAGTDFDPETTAIDKAVMEFINKKMDATLSNMERRVIELYLEGRSYASIAGIMNKDEKSIDNTLQRAKVKIRKIIDEKERKYA